ncbi:FixH family protein [uncultured Thiodictyon sp.]|uniref:FixH family protein n=1 Tax=uncultured Thiodictyon sp. TaxID=1846217 RepID=UPI0025CCF9E6|nr:FixH family protein [uncultured Thiodictyon sp.]
MQASATTGDTLNSPWRNPWVLAWVGLVATVLVVNATFIYFAIATNPGLVADDYYDRGQRYEKTLNSRLAKAPGWTQRIDIPDDIKAKQSATILVTLVDKTGQPVTPERVNFFAYRPSDKSADFSVPMVVEGPGRYSVRVTFPLFGAWDALIAVRHDGDEVTTGERIQVARP